jgi:hypothetical protein
MGPMLCAGRTQPDWKPVTRFLDHSSLAAATVRLRRVEGDRDITWQRVAEALGISSSRFPSRIHSLQTQRLQKCPPISLVGC